MTKLIYFLLLSFSFQTFGQTAPRVAGDSLIKYSYTLLGVNRSPSGDVGTCFFINKDNNIYLVTAKHVFYECDPLLKKIRRKFKTGIVYISSAHDAIVLEVPEINDSCSLNDTDLFVAKVDKKWSGYLNYVDDFFSSPFKKHGDLEIFGQGIGRDSGYVYFDEQHHIHVNKNSFKLWVGIKPQNGIIDNSVYVFELDSALDRRLKGFSGSPVFLENKKTNKWVIMGVFVAAFSKDEYHQNLSKAFIVIRPEVIFDKISSLH